MQKKIAVVATVPFALQVFMRSHIAMLAEQNEVTLITNGTERDLNTMLGEHVHFINVKVSRKTALFSDLRALIALIFIFRKHHFDVVHSVMPKTGLLAMLAAWVTRVPCRIHTFTGQVWANKSGLVRWGLCILDKVIAFCSTALLVDSMSQRDFLIQQRIADEKKMTVLGSGSVCGVDVLRFRPDSLARKRIRAKLGIPDDALIFIFLGRVNQDKGVLDLAQAFVEVSQAVAGTHLLVVGPDEGGMDLLLQAILAPCASHFHRIGLTDKPEEYMACADIFCLPSYREGFGSVIIEAAAAGLPAVASDIYGLVDAVSRNETGLLHEAKNIGQLRDALILLATDESVRRDMAEKAYRRAHNYFSQEIVTGEMHRYYHAISFN